MCQTARIQISLKSLSDATAAGTGTSKARILNILEFFGPLESPSQDLTTVDGTSIWAGDRVHLTSNATRVVAMKLMVSIAGKGETPEPANKRARLESVIPVKTTPLPAAKAAQLAPPPTPKPVPPPLWLSGQLPVNQRGKMGRPQHEREPAGNCEYGPLPGRTQAGPEVAAQAAGAVGRKNIGRVYFLSSPKLKNCDKN
jgi:hypothetical protein